MSDPVADGREALNQWFGYPWYDSSVDGIRRVEVSRPWNFHWNWLPEGPGDFLGSLLQALAWVGIVAVLIGVAYLLIRAYSRRDRRSAADGEEPAGTADRVESLPVPLDRGRMDLLAEARQCYERGDYGQAIIYYFSYQLVQLDKRQIIRLGQGKTNRQYLREVGPRSGLRSMLEQTMVAFEDVYFGHCALERDRFERCWSQLDEFETLVQTTM